MKKCKKCYQIFDDRYDFCPRCGVPLSAKQPHRRNPAVWLLPCCFCIAVIVISSVVIVNQNRTFHDARSRVESEKMDRYIQEQLNKAGKGDLKIESGWTWKVKGNYIYINGSVKNTGSKTIHYFEVDAEFLDYKKNVVDTDYTNSAQDLKPNASKSFEIMHKNDSSIRDITLKVSEVN